MLSILETILISISLLSSAEISTYFSKTKGAYYKGGVDNLIIKDIADANKTVYMEMYYLTNKNITKALIEAHKRGLDVKIFTDDKKIKSKRYKSLINYGIDIRDDKDKKALMHNKILIIDNTIVWIGSGNYTVFSFYRNYENFIRLYGKRVTEYYKYKFNTLYNKVDRDIQPYTDNRVEVYFSKNSNIENIIIKNISKAEISIDIMMFAFTNKQIADALIEAKKRGVEVKIILDRVQNRYQRKYSVYNYLKDKGIDISLENSKRKLHNKVMVIDNKIVITGSYNYTKQANLINDENILIIKDEVIANKFIEKLKYSFSLPNS